MRDVPQPPALLEGGYDSKSIIRYVMTHMPFLRTPAALQSVSSAALTMCRIGTKSVGFSLAAVLLLSSCSGTSEPEPSNSSPEQTAPSSQNEPEPTNSNPPNSDSGEPGNNESEDIAADDNPSDNASEEDTPDIRNSDTEESPTSNGRAFDLLPGFYPDPETGTGVISGTVEATNVTGTDSTPSGACEGFINEAPDHQVTLEDDFNYLALEVDSSSPASLVIVGENGDHWCASGSGPRVEADTWAQGSYDVYVGNPEAPESGDRYELSISEINPNPSNQFGSAPFQEGPDSFGQGDYAPISVAPGFEPDPAIGTGNTGGPLLATDVTGVTDTETGECQGYIDTTADHFLTLEQPFRYLKVQAESSSPTSLVILGPGGESWCFTGSNPFIEGVWDAGEYQVYLANLGEAGVGDRYELLVTELD